MRRSPLRWATRSRKKAPEPERPIESDFRIFTVFCLSRGLVAMPATASAVARFLSSQADGGLKGRSRSGRRAAAVAYAHKLAGFEPPTGAETVKAVVRGTRRTIGAAPVRKAAATADVVTQMLSHCPDTLRGLRDAALLSLGLRVRSADRSWSR